VLRFSFALTTALRQATIYFVSGRELFSAVVLVTRSVRVHYVTFEPRILRIQIRSCKIIVRPVPPLPALLNWWRIRWVERSCSPPYPFSFHYSFSIGFSRIKRRSSSTGIIQRPPQRTPWMRPARKRSRRPSEEMGRRRAALTGVTYPSRTSFSTAEPPWSARLTQNPTVCITSKSTAYHANGLQPWSTTVNRICNW
jgi:hypothetical protein